MLPFVLLLIGFIITCKMLKIKLAPVESNYFIKNKNNIKNNNIKNNVVKNVNDIKKLKLVFIVNEDLKMGKGKMISQCMHAYDALLERVYKSNDLSYNYYYECYKKWKRQGCAKIVVKAKTDQFNEIYEKLFYNSSNLNYIMIKDAGRTQIAPNSSTVIGIGPDEAERIDEYTRDLRLL